MTNKEPTPFEGQSTPGPWRKQVQKKGNPTETIIETCNGLDIATVHDYSVGVEECLFNTRLISKAYLIPKCVEMLKLAVGLLDTDMDSSEIKAIDSLITKLTSNE